MVGKRGRVIGRIAPGIVGEVMLPVRGATEAFYAYPETDEVLEVGTQVVVGDFDPPRTVYAARAIYPTFPWRGNALDVPDHRGGRCGRPSDPVPDGVAG